MNKIKALNRRQFISSGMKKAGLMAGGVAGGILTPPAPSLASAHKKLASAPINKGLKSYNMAMSWPKGSPGPAKAAELFANSLFELSDGRISINIYGAGELIPGDEVFDAITEGIIDFAHTASFYWRGKIPASVFFTTIPFGLNPRQHDSWLEHEGNALWQDLYAPFGLYPMAAGNVGPSMAGWFKKPINSLDDIKGLKIRMAGLGASIFKELGASPVFLTPSEITQGYAGGVVDGVEFLGPYMDEGFGLQKFSSHYYGNGFTKPNGTSELLVAKSIFESMAKDEQAFVKMAAKYVNETSLSQNEWQNSLALTRIKQHVKVARLPDDIYQKAKPLSLEIIQDSLGQDKKAISLFDQYRKAQDLLANWSNLKT